MSSYESGFSPSYPTDDVRKHIDELEMGVYHLRDKIRDINPASPLGRLRAAMAITQTEIAVFNTVLDKVVKQGKAKLLCSYFY